MKKMLKRADGSTSQRGLWDNIRAKAAANKKAGKKGKAPSKAILEQEAKIKSKGMGGPGDPPPADSTATKNKLTAMTEMLKNTANNSKMLEAAKNAYKREDKLTATTPPLPRIKYINEPMRRSTERKKSGGKSTWLMESKELKFGGPINKKNKYLDGGPSMDTKTAVGQVFQGKMTAAQGQAAIGKTAKPAMTPEQKTEFMSKLKTYGKKTGGKKRMGGKNC